jgi:hypothetical protein
VHLDGPPSWRQRGRSPPANPEQLSPDIGYIERDGTVTNTSRQPVANIEALQ